MGNSQSLPGVESANIEHRISNFELNVPAFARKHEQRTENVEG